MASRHFNRGVLFPIPKGSKDVYHEGGAMKKRAQRSTTRARAKKRPSKQRGAKKIICSLCKKRPCGCY
ncbi:MAG: hypothetical protein A2Y28_02130 [Chlamydiae bacterium GWC2_50_10]|nr:MAG: hypothetical protein A2Y28_02130 [Chlamydiae bacterium GWC2_50_10]